MFLLAWLGLGQIIVSELYAASGRQLDKQSNGKINYGANIAWQVRRSLFGLRRRSS